MNTIENFPQPSRIGENCIRWPLSALLSFEAARAGREPPTIPADDERWLSAAQVCARFGIGRTTLWRWTSATDGKAGAR